MDGNEFVLGIKNGDEDALRELQNKYGRLLYGIAKDILGKKYSLDIIDECYSDIIVTIWRNIDQFDDKRGKLTNFIASIAKFKAIDCVRKLDKRKETIINEEILEASYVDELKDEQLEAFEELLNILSDDDKVLFVKRYYFEENIEKISLDMNISKDTVYKKLSRGREKLKFELEGLL